MSKEKINVAKIKPLATSRFKNRTFSGSLNS